MSIKIDFLSLFSKGLLLRKNRLKTLLWLLTMTTGLIAALITLVFSELKKQDIRKSQLGMEKSRVEQIDKQLNLFYHKMYAQNDTTFTNKTVLNDYLRQIEFFKNQRLEAVKNIDQINQNPDTQVVIFTVFASVLTFVILFFFSSSFKTSETFGTTFNRIKNENRTLFSSGTDDFLYWATTNEIAENNLDGLDLNKAKKLKKIYDLSEKLGSEKNDLLNEVISFSNIKRKQDELQREKYSKIGLVFEEMQTRLKEEYSRLNKQAVINFEAVK